ncbi:MBL fold metallo-hydrolase [Halosegnis sp.]|uniref:MBL fold metallo-hydrolase n=1 Tax=Halosegnis sp. TaxID=2864959 RepID=UPI0035D4C59F
MVTEPVAGVYDITCTETDDDPGRIRAYLTDDGTLVDTGLTGTTDTLLAGITEVGVAVERVVITHTDPDHIGGIKAVVEAHDSTVYLPEGADHPTADVFYGEGDTVGPFEAVHVPGHRDHQHVLVATDEGYAVLADALSGADQRGLSGGFHLPPGKFTDDLNEAERSLEKLLDYEFEAGLVFHGSSVLEGASETLEQYVLPP